jgi:predicted metal-dependent phosphoesterase TrpH
MSHRLRADLHVHTCHSTQNGTVPFLHARDCYSAPADVYRTAKQRGMDLVAITDHDSIDGGLELLAARPGADDIIVGEEITCWFPDSTLEVHIAAYDMTEALHRDVQPLRRNVFEVAARLREAGVFFALNHLLHFYRGQVPLEAYLRLLDDVPALEVRNGTMLPGHNLMIERLVSEWRPPHGGRLAVVAGSDAHTLRRVGRTWTSAPGVSRSEFMRSLRAGLGEPGGSHGGVSAVAGDAYGVVASYIASLVSGDPPDVRSWHRAGCLAFSVATLPMQGLPLIIAAARKHAERRAIGQVRPRLMSAETADAGAEA